MELIEAMTSLSHEELTNYINNEALIQNHEMRIDDVRATLFKEGALT